MSGRRDRPQTESLPRLHGLPIGERAGRQLQAVEGGGGGAEFSPAGGRRGGGRGVVRVRVGQTDRRHGSSGNHLVDTAEVRFIRRSGVQHDHGAGPDHVGLRPGQGERARVVGANRRDVRSVPDDAGRAHAPSHRASS